MTPEELVPLRETCELLKAAGFPQDNAHWAWYMARPFAKWEKTFLAEFAQEGEYIVAAPTLAEILAELPPVYHGGSAPHDVYYLTLTRDEGGFTVQYISVGGCAVEGSWVNHGNGAEAAALLCLALKEHAPADQD